MHIYVHAKTPKERKNGVSHEKDPIAESLKLSVPYVHIWCAKTSSHTKTDSHAKTKSHLHVSTLNARGKLGQT